MSIDRKQELIQYAIRMISERGYDSFSFADLARLSGITKASIHHHFATKTDLGLAVLDSMQAFMVEKVAQLANLSAKSAIVNVLQTAMNYPWQARICTFTSLHAEFNVLPEALQKRLQEITRFEENVVAEILGRYADERGVPLKVNPSIAARMAISATKGAMLYGRTQQTVWTPQVLGATLAVLGVDDLEGLT